MNKVLIVLTIVALACVVTEVQADAFTKIINSLKPSIDKLLHDSTGKVKAELKKQVHKEIKRIPLLPSFEKKRIEKRIYYFIDNPLALKKLLGV